MFQGVVIVVGALVAGGTAIDAGQAQAQLSCADIDGRDRILVAEAYHLQAELGPKVWPDWTARAVPLLYKTGSCDFLINHPKPPSGFQRASDLLDGREYWYQMNQDTVAYRAAYPINDILTAVLTRPADAEQVHEWTLEAVHEFFHAFQHEHRPSRIVDPFSGSHSGENELSYPFPYDSELVKSFMRVEAEEVFRSIREPQADDAGIRVAVRVLGHVNRLAGAVFEDSADIRYKRWLEWSEGVARYTEREIAALAAADQYVPSPAFAARHGAAGYHDTWTTSYLNALNPIRFVGEGVRGRVQFYYLGMGKAYLLDRFRPEWQLSYFDAHLDDLLLR